MIDQSISVLSISKASNTSQAELVAKADMQTLQGSKAAGLTVIDQSITVEVSKGKRDSGVNRIAGLGEQVKNQRIV